MDEGVSIVDTPAQASVGDAVKVEPPTEDRVSDTPQPVIDVESPDKTVPIKEEGRSGTRREGRTSDSNHPVFNASVGHPG
ncbi:hypothetical protein PHMEG_00016039 [Phytophthora megakarya]|uniref:Uncharacterized protein n=1 Tax=Phytophthora megakarya TaxID=4795 RepID=A0A225W089_9STRA|nr:hypothetical protein PHMEG_00016039 [Phytophthora megakarya]